MPNPIYILNGPNLNRLGTREPSVYGKDTLDDVREACARRAGAFGFDIEFRQTNSEGALIDWVQEAADRASALVINPAGYGHTSVALRDALMLVAHPIIEVHLSHPAAREPFRARSLSAPAARGAISGFGLMSYELGVEAAARLAAEEPHDG